MKGKETRKLHFGNQGYIEQEYDLETGIVTFQGQIKFDRKKKDEKRIFYYSLVDHEPVISYLRKAPPYRKTGAEKDVADELVKLHYGVDMNE